jgi:hypothetical protein
VDLGCTLCDMATTHQGPPEPIRGLDEMTAAIGAVIAGQTLREISQGIHLALGSLDDGVLVALRPGHDYLVISYRIKS